MKRVLITGGAGYLGLHVTDILLAQGVQVRILDNFSASARESVKPNVEVHTGDTRDIGSLDRATVGIDRIIHLAAVGSVEAAQRNPVESGAINVDSTVNVLAAARNGLNGPIPVVYASSAAVYGHGKGKLLTENELAAPISSYGVDKLRCEQLAQEAFALHGVPSVGLRIFNAFGPALGGADRQNGVISRFCADIAANRPVTIFGDGRQTRDFIYVADVAKAIVACLEREEGATILNVCTGTETTVIDVAEQIASLCKRDLRFAKASSREEDIVRSVGCPKRAAAEIGFRAVVGLSQGLGVLLGAAAISFDQGNR